MLICSYILNFSSIWKNRQAGITESSKQKSGDADSQETAAATAAAAAAVSEITAQGIPRAAIVVSRRPQLTLKDKHNSIMYLLSIG